MIKSVVKFSIVFILTALMAICATSTAYIVTKKVINSGDDAVKQGTHAPVDAAQAAEKEALEAKALVPDYYTVRLEGETLGVYAAFSEREDFLYNAEIYRTNLSAEDIRLLTSGVRLQNHAELTSFIEDYTS